MPDWPDWPDWRFRPTGQTDPARLAPDCLRVRSQWGHVGVTLMVIWADEADVDITLGHYGVTMGSLWDISGSLRDTLGSLGTTLEHFSVALTPHWNQKTAQPHTAL